MSDNFPHRLTPCPECPWRKDVPVGKFPPERFQDLAGTAYDMSPRVFGCHMSSEEHTVGCAGFLINSSTHNLSVRMATMKGEFDRRKLFSDVELYDNYREMAVANGVDIDDESLDNCRDDN